MFKDFDATKKQLAELAEVLNGFKSESVQLKVLELLFGAETREADTTTPSSTDTERSAANLEKRSRRKRPAAKKAKTPSSASKKSNGRATPLGAVAIVARLYGEGFFAKAKTISDICNHADVHLARKIKPNEISGKLGRMVRTGELSRVKNDDNQYEYTKP